MGVKIYASRRGIFWVLIGKNTRIDTKIDLFFKKKKRDLVSKKDYLSTKNQFELTVILFFIDIY